MKTQGVKLLSKSLSPELEQKLLLIGTVFFWSALYIYVPILSPYAEFLSKSLTIVGFVVASYGLSQLLFRFPIGIWSDNTGKRKQFVISGFVFAFISGVGLALSPNSWFLLIFRGLSGVSASMWVVFTVLYSSYFHDNHTTRAMSLITFCTGFAQMISSYVGGKIADSYGWVAPFYAGAGLAFLGMLTVLPISEKSVNKRVRLSFKKLILVASQKRLVLVSVITALSQFSIFITTYGFLPVYASRINASKSELGLLLFIIHLFQTLSMFMAGTIVAPRIGYRTTVCTAYFTVSLSTFVTPYIRSLPPLFLIQGLGALGRGLAYPILMGLAIQNVKPEDRATAMGFFQAVYGIGMFLGPALGGRIGDAFGLSSVFFCAAVVYIIAFLMSIYALPGRIRNA